MPFPTVLNYMKREAKDRIDPELIYCFLNFRGLGYLGILYHSLHMAHFTNILVDMLNM